jgi:hypothetical protein
MSVNNWPRLRKILKELHDQHVIKNIYKKNDIILSVKELVKNDIVTLVHYYQHKINNFQIKNIYNVLFGEIQDYFLLLNFKVED